MPVALRRPCSAGAGGCAARSGGRRKIPARPRRGAAKRPRNGFQRQAEIIADVAAAHRQRHHACDREAAIHLKQEVRDPLHRVLASEQQHVIFRMPQFAGRHAPELARDLDVALCRLLKAAALHQAHGGVDDGFRREPVVGAGFQPEDIARQMKCADLAPSVGKQLVGANGAADDLVDIFRRLILAVDFLVLAVGELGGNKARMAGQRRRTGRGWRR